MSGDRSAWDEDFYDEVRRAGEEDAEQEYAARWVEVWDRLAPLGIVGPEDRGLTLSELERLAAYLSPALAACISTVHRASSGCTPERRA